MSNIDIVRAWKDEEYRNSLSEEQRSQLPENPAGMVELSDEDMEALAGGFNGLFAPGNAAQKSFLCPDTTATVVGSMCCHHPSPIMSLPFPIPTQRPSWYGF